MSFDGGKNRSLFLLGCIVFISAASRAAGENPTLASPRMSAHGVVFTDEAGSALYIVSGGVTRRLLSARGCGMYYTLSPDRQQIGAKVIGPDGLQQPTIIDIQKGVVRPLMRPVRRAGQVSIARNGSYAFTIAESLHVVREQGESCYYLGSYSNIAALSPDGNMVAFNDANDQIWILNLRRSLRRKASDGRVGYFKPQWSPNGLQLLYSSLAGNGFVYDVATESTSQLGEAHAASWSDDGTVVVFTRSEVSGGVLVNSDVFCSSPDGRTVRRLTATPGVLEFDPHLDRGILLYHTGDDRTIWEVRNRALEEDTLSKQQGPTKVLCFSPVREAHTLPPSFQKNASSQNLDIPYVHQTYDTPDWHNGNSSCAPAAAIMLIAYHQILPQWPIPCSTPYLHYSNWGGYVADKYYFRGVDYAAYQTTVYNSPVWGGFGYMWKTGSPQSRMAGYYNLHGIQTIQSFSTPHNIAVEEVLAGRPFSMCTLLTSSGHLTLAHGFGNEVHTLVFNDPYGDKNRGYKNYYGKNVSYDWPGYNNGFANLIEVAWCIAAQYIPPSAADTLVDDLHFGRGFYLHSQAPASMTMWKDYTFGWEGHAWWTPSTVSDTCYAQWTPVLTRSGRYELFAYIHLGGEANAAYKITHGGGTAIVQFDQSGHQGKWVSLGEYFFAAGTIGSVRLGSGSTVRGRPMAFDAIRWSYRGTTDAATTPILPTHAMLHQNYPNPFNPSTSFEFQVPSFQFVTLKVLDLLGREVATLVQESLQPGTYLRHWNASGFPSGVYFYRMQAGSFTETRRMILSK